MAKKKTTKKASKKTKKVVKKKSPSASAILKEAPKIDTKPINIKKISDNKSVPIGIAAVALALNIIIPGIGSILGKRIKHGFWQLILLIIGAAIITPYPVSGSLVIAITWIWGIITGVTIIRDSK